MGATTLGAAIGGAIDAADGDDSVIDGAMTGAIVANALKVAVPLAIAGTIAWMAYKGAVDIVDMVMGEDREQPA